MDVTDTLDALGMYETLTEIKDQHELQRVLMEHVVLNAVPAAAQV